MLYNFLKFDSIFPASANLSGTGCPMALRLVACVLLLEITAFLRETYQTLPKSSRSSTRERPPPWERIYSKEANRRWSMALSSMGHSQTSAQSLQSITGEKDGGEHNFSETYQIYFHMFFSFSLTFILPKFIQFNF